MKSESTHPQSQVRVMDITVSDNGRAGLDAGD